MCGSAISSASWWRSASSSIVCELDRVRGSHHIYLHRAIGERVNLQSQRGEAKPYQLRQVLDLVVRYDLAVEEQR